MGLARWMGSSGLALVLFVLPVRAATTSAVPFLTLIPSARSAALGGVWSAVVDDDTAVLSNPASLRRLTRFSASLFHATGVGEGQVDFMGFGCQIGNAGALGIGAQLFSPGAVERNDLEGNTVGNFSPMDGVLAVAYARDFSGILVGLGGKYIRSKLADTASGGALDAGIVSPAFLEGHVRLSAVVNNWGPDLRYLARPEPLPRSFRAGFSWTLSREWNFMGDVVVPRGKKTHAGVGVEYQAPLEGPWDVFFRGGCITEPEDQKWMNRLSAGVGFLHQNFGVDYAWGPLGQWGQSHRFSLRFRFGPEPAASIPKEFPVRSGRPELLDIK